MSSLTTTAKTSAVAAINEVNNKIAKLETITLGSQHTCLFANKFCVFGSVAVLYLELLNAPTTSATLCTIPSGYRPAYRKGGVFTAFNSNSSDVNKGYVHIIVNPNGNVSLTPKFTDSSNTFVYATLVWMIGQ